ncbi:MAG: MmgE/PrpD family protein [Rhizomicrobium sp.]
MNGNSPTSMLAEFAAQTSLEAVPEAAIHAAKRLLLDTVGCAIGGAAIPSARIVAKVVGAFGGAAEATVLSSGRKLPAALAAHINAHASNALDAEDTTLWSGHLSGCTVMPCLAMAERTRCSGRELLAVLAIAFDVVSRIGLSMRQIAIDEDGKVRLGVVRGHGWTAFGASAAAGRLLRLDTTRMLDAFGLTGSMAPMPSTGHWLYLPDHRPMSKYAMFGACAEAGVTAALLAAEGFTSDRAILDGDTGLWRMMGSPGVDWSVIGDRLGARWLIEETSFKLYPSCRFSHPIIDMALEIRRALDLKPAEIDRVQVAVPQAAFNLRMDDRRVENAVDSQFSIPYLTALALHGTPFGPDWHSDAMRSRSDIAALSAKVEVSPHPKGAEMVMAQLRETGRAIRFPFEISVQARGRRLERSTTYAIGDPWAGVGLGDEELVRKFRVYSAGRLTAARADEACSIMLELDREPNLDRLLARL